MPAASASTSNTSILRLATNRSCTNSTRQPYKSAANASTKICFLVVMFNATIHKAQSRKKIPTCTHLSTWSLPIHPAAGNLLPGKKNSTAVIRINKIAAGNANLFSRSTLFVFRSIKKAFRRRPMVYFKTPDYPTREP